MGAELIDDEPTTTAVMTSRPTTTESHGDAVGLLPFAPHVMRIPNSVVGRWILVVLLGIIPLSSTGLAYASPPDPISVPGIYDDGDHDDVVAILTLLSAIHLRPVVIAHWTHRVGSISSLPEVQIFGLASFHLVESRAPPSA